MTTRLLVTTPAAFHCLVSILDSVALNYNKALMKCVKATHFQRQETPPADPDRRVNRQCLVSNRMEDITEPRWKRSKEVPMPRPPSHIFYSEMSTLINGFLLLISFAPRLKDLVFHTNGYSLQKALKVSEESYPALHKPGQLAQRECQDCPKPLDLLSKSRDNEQNKTKHKKKIPSIG